MAVSQPKFFAEISLLRSEQGGRSNATPADAFACIAVVKGKNFDVRLDLSAVGSLLPGATASVPMRFLDPASAHSVFKPGTRFDLREARTIGHGTIRRNGQSDAPQRWREGAFGG